MTVEVGTIDNVCNCIEETEIKFKDHLEKNKPELKNLDVRFENRAWLMNSGKTELVIPMIYEWEHTAKSGRVSNKKKVQNFIMQYCPFCGEKLRD